jgi:predicted RNA-binding Zn-ribbon protein involved in translation (DUF1610 family)
MAEEIPRRLRRRVKSAGKKKEAEKKPEPRRSIAKLPERFFENVIRRDVAADSHAIASSKVKEFREKNKRAPNSAEVEGIAEEVYRQLKDDYERRMREEREELRKKSLLEREKQRIKQAVERGRKEAERDERKAAQQKRMKGEAGEKELPPEEGKAGRLAKPLPEEEEALPTEEEKEAEEEPIEPLPEEKGESLSLEEVEELSTGAEGQLEELEEEIETAETEIETGKNVCPECGNKADEIVFCPECGTGFCAHCAEAVKVDGREVRYKCPSCGHTVKTQVHG